MLLWFKASKHEARKTSSMASTRVKPGIPALIHSGRLHIAKWINLIRPKRWWIWRSRRETVWKSWQVIEQGSTASASMTSIEFVLCGHTAAQIKLKLRIITKGKYDSRPDKPNSNTPRWNALGRVFDSDGFNPASIGWRHSCSLPARERFGARAAKHNAKHSSAVSEVFWQQRRFLDELAITLGSLFWRKGRKKSAYEDWAFW